STAQQVFDIWQNSAGHNTNMLNSTYQMIGIARAYTSGSPYGWYWVTDFGLVNDGTNGSGGSSPGATKVAFTTQPGNGTSGSALGPQPVVTVQDANGNTVTTDTSTVTLALVGAGGPLACTGGVSSVARAAVAGVATFTGCAVTGAGTYTLNSTDGS